MIKTKTQHTIWHHLIMILIEEIENFLWLLVVLLMVAGGLALILFSQGTSFFMMVLGLPLVLIGIMLVLSKMHEIILTVVDQSRIRAICKFCQEDD